MPDPSRFRSLITGSFSSPAGANAAVAMVEATYRDLGLDARYLNCEVPPGGLFGIVWPFHRLPAGAILSSFRNRSRSGAKFAYSGNSAPPIARASLPIVPASTRGRATPSQL